MSYVLYDNKITEREHVKIDLEDRGYNFGDGIYEVIPIYKGKLFVVKEHLQRFRESADKLEIKLPYHLDLLEELLHQLKEKNQTSDGIIYIQMTRGVTPRNHLYERNAIGLITGFSRNMNFPIKEKELGIDVYLTEDIRWLRCDIKTINLLGNTMAKRQATDHHCHEAILHRENTLTEGSSSNLFIIKENVIYTHPPTNLILNGITRQLVIRLAKAEGFLVNEEPFSLKQLKEADEVFITNTTHEVCPVVKIKGNLQANYPIGPITKKLQYLYTKNVNDHL